MADLFVLRELGLRLEEFMGKQVTSFYKDLTHYRNAGLKKWGGSMQYKTKANHEKRKPFCNH